MKHIELMKKRLTVERRHGLASGAGTARPRGFAAEMIEASVEATELQEPTEFGRLHARLDHLHRRQADRLRRPQVPFFVSSMTFKSFVSTGLTTSGLAG